MRVASVGIGDLDAAVVSSQDPYVTSFVGPYADLNGCASCSVLDRPYKQDVSGLPLAKMLGYHLGIPALQNAKPTDEPNVAMARATNLASLVTATLLKLKPNERQEALEAYGGIAWTDKVLRFAGKLPGVIGISDGIRFSLGMHFIVGLMEAEFKKDTDNARAYLAFVKVFRQAETERREGIISPLGGLGTLASVGDFFASAANAVVGVAKSAADGIQKAADFGSDLICKGLKGLLGEAVGGAICWLITKGLQIITSAVKALVEITATAITSLLDFLKYLGQGKPMEAIKALFMGVTKMVFLLFLPVSEPFMGVKAAQLKEIGDRVAKKNPFFPLTLVLAIVGIIPTPTTTTLSVLILALAPAIAVMLGDTLAKLLKWTREKAEDAIEKFVKIGLVVFQGFMTLQDILPRLKTQVAAYLKKKGGVGGALSDAAGKVVDKLKAQWGKVAEAFKSGKLQEASAAISTLLSFSPELFGGLLEDTSGDLPAFSETVQAIKDIPGTVDRQEAALKQANTQILNSMGLEERRAVVMDNAAQLQPQQAGTLTAKVFYENAIAQQDPAKRRVFQQAFEAQANTYKR